MIGGNGLIKITAVHVQIKSAAVIRLEAFLTSEMPGLFDHFPMSCLFAIATLDFLLTPAIKIARPDHASTRYPRLDKLLAANLKKAKMARAEKPYFYALVLKGGTTGKLLIERMKIKMGPIQAAKKAIEAAPP